MYQRAGKRSRSGAAGNDKDNENELDPEEELLKEVEGADEYVPVQKRRENEKKRFRRAIGEDTDEDEDKANDRNAEAGTGPDNNNESLLERTAAGEVDKQTDEEKKKAEEEEIMGNVTEQRSLMAAHEIAKGVRYTKSMDSGWRAPKQYREASEDAKEALRKKHNIIVQGDSPPPPIPTFAGMRLPKVATETLRRLQIDKPTPVQIQALPAVLSGRDLIGVAYTGSGKTLVFTLPMAVTAAQHETAMPLEAGEGPLGLALCPSRELARQTHSVLGQFLDNAGDEITLRSSLCVGGVSSSEQIEPFKRQGCHMVVATPGRLKDHLSKGRFRLGICRFMCLDEADRMIDLGFEEDVREILSYFTDQRQTVMFSATMPMKIRAFAEASLVNPLVVNVSRAGAANLDVVQEVEYVKEEDKPEALLGGLQKTEPPVLVFSEAKADVDRVHETLLRKGVEAVAIHGGWSQEDRNEAIDGFKRGEKDVLVATDIASKGLDFKSIQHVINYDMPKEIENYVHRIGRTGRQGRTGRATTFINRSQNETTLIDLKQLLIEAKQKIPPPLELVAGDDDSSSGCSFCGGLGHRIAACPKLEKQKEDELKTRSRRDPFSGGGFSAEL